MEENSQVIKKLNIVSEKPISNLYGSFLPNVQAFTFDKSISIIRHPEKWSLKSFRAL